MVNVLWGAFNLAVAYLLIVRVGDFELRQWRHVLLVSAGGLLTAIMLSQAFGQIYGD